MIFSSHEVKTEKFYEVGVEKFGDYHSRYLNFGMWDNGIVDYIKASENLLKRVADKIGLNDQSHLLDVACGMGTQDTFFIKTYNCSKIDGLDLTKKHIDIAKQYNCDSRIVFTQGNACQLPFANEMFTHVIGIEGPANFNTREDFFKEAFRTLKPGGKLGLSDYLLPRKPKNWYEKLLIKNIVRLWHMPIQNVQTREEFKETLEKIGYINVEVDVVTDSVIPGYLVENRKLESRKEIYRIRGWLWGRLSDYLDDFVDWLYQRKLVDYVLLKAEKPIV